MNTIKKQLRRAFTIVELVIVIAVIAALAAILIPTFVNVLSSANESVDTSLVKNLNTILTSDETLNGSKASNMSEALEWVEDNGYKVENLTPTSTGEILWNQTSNRFVLVNSEGEIIYKDDTTTDSLGYTYWKVTSDSAEAESGVYSYYLNSDFTTDETLTVTTGIDVGENEEISVEVVEDNSSSYANAQTTVSSVKKAVDEPTNNSTKTLIFNTNGGKLTINNSSVEVKHYGSANAVTVTNASSYTTAASVTTITVEVSITVTVESGASIMTLNAGSYTVTVTISNSAEVSGVVGDSVTVSGNTTNTATYKTDEYASYLAYVGGNFYKKLTDAVSAASNGATVTLLKDYKSSSSTGYFKNLCLNLSKEVTIDLNGYTISGVAQENELTGGTTSLTLKNGTLTHTTTSGTSGSYLSVSLFKITSGASISFENMEVTSTYRTVLYPRNDATSVNVINSTITTTGAYCISTNAGDEKNYNVKINVDNSTLIANTPVLVNVPGTYNFTNSTISTEKMYPCFIARGGNVTIDNCVICLNNSLNSYDSSTLWDRCMDDDTDTSYQAWTEGNGVPYSALCVGNDADSSDYQYPTTCTVTNTEFHTGTGFMCVYVEGNNSEANGVTFNYGGCSFYYHTSGTILENLDGGIAYGTTTPTEYNASLYNSEKTNPLDYAIIYTSDTASYVTINGTVYRNGTN